MAAAFYNSTNFGHSLPKFGKQRVYTDTNMMYDN